MLSIHGCESKHGSWVAVLDSGPSHEPQLRVTGMCTCPTGGFELSLRKAAHQGMHPRILVLELTAKPPSVATDQMMTDHEVQFELQDSPWYTDVRIVPFDISVPVDTGS
jgi:hypothetical protein